MNYLAFKKFLASAGLSTRRFGDLCGIGKTTVHRLAQPHHGALTPKYVKSITPSILRACQDHLTASGASADAIHLILLDIFGEEFTPSIVTRATLTPDMLRFFGLSSDPFASPRNASEIFLTDEMEHIRAVLDNAVKFQGFVAVLAPVGAGKTVIKNLMLSPRSQVPKVPGGKPEKPDLGSGTWDLGLRVLSPAFPDMSRVTAAGIVSYILESLGQKPRRSLVLAQKQLEDHLAELTTPVALCFDECHRLSDTTLTALKNFYELGTGGFQRYLGLVLFGQPQFELRLQLPRFREIAERLAVHQLSPFSAEDTENFLDHCLQLARPTNPKAQVPRVPNTSLNIDSAPLGLETWDLGPTSVFAPDAIHAIASRASTPLTIANLAAAGMIEAYRMGERQVTARFIPEDRGPRAVRV